MPSKLVSTNQFGEQSQSYVQGSVMPIAPLTGDVVMFHGAGAPVDGTTGANVAGIGSIYIRRDTGKMYINGGTKAVPAWKLVTSA